MKKLRVILAILAFLLGVVSFGSVGHSYADPEDTPPPPPTSHPGG